MKLRYVVPVAVLALALVFGGGSAFAVFDGNNNNTITVTDITDNSDNSITDSSSTNINNIVTDNSDNRNINNSDNSVTDNSTVANTSLNLDLSVDLSLTSTDIDINDNSVNPWNASVNGNAFRDAIGISQASVIAGAGNSVAQTVTGINANQVAVGNTALSIF